jgi:IS30 family transposase
MGQRYGQLGLKERIDLYRLHADGKGVRAIARVLGRSPATISRELRRNSQKTKVWAGGYDPARAQSLAERRRRWDGRFKLVRQPALQKQIRDYLAMGWSPEQIAGRLALLQGSTVISPESIYRFVYHHSGQKDYWHKLLPRQKHRRGRFGRQGGSPVVHIKQRVSISQRPAFIEKRRQPGHWESDYILFSKSGQAVLVAQERSTRFIQLAKPPTRKADETFSNLFSMLSCLPPSLCRTMTQDNGTEFATHYMLRDALGIKTYFCNPHSPWQKGGIENMNGRLRRWLPRQCTAPVQPDRGHLWHRRLETDSCQKLH